MSLSRPRIVTSALLLLISFALTACSSGNGDGASDDAPVKQTISSSESAGTPVEYRNPYKVPIELRKQIRRDSNGVPTETLTGIPTMFVLSYSCDNEGKKSLTLTKYPPFASTKAEIRADGKTITRGDLDEGAIRGPFVESDGSQTVIARQATEPETKVAKVTVKFDAENQCRVDDLDLKLHREPRWKPRLTQAPSGKSGPKDGTYRDPKSKVAAIVPRTWRAISDPVTSVLYPRQVLAAASFRTGKVKAPRSCTPVEVLDRMPDRGAFLTIIEYRLRASNGQKVAVPDLPAKKRKLSYRDGTYGSFECSGPSYQFTFSQSGRAFQAQVWFNRRLVSPANRADALKIVRTFHPTPP